MNSYEMNEMKMYIKHRIMGILSLNVDQVLLASPHVSMYNVSIYTIKNNSFLCLGWYECDNYTDLNRFNQKLNGFLECCKHKYEDVKLDTPYYTNYLIKNVCKKFYNIPC